MQSGYPWNQSDEILLRFGTILLSLVNVLRRPMVNWAIKTKVVLKDFVFNDSWQVQVTPTSPEPDHVAERFQLSQWTSYANFYFCSWIFRARLYTHVTNWTLRFKPLCLLYWTIWGILLKFAQFCSEYITTVWFRFAEYTGCANKNPSSCISATANGQSEIEHIFLILYVSVRVTYPVLTLITWMWSYYGSRGADSSMPAYILPGNCKLYTVSQKRTNFETV